MIRTLLVDDDAAHRQLLHLILEAEPDFEVAGEAPDGLAGIEMAAELQPDLVISDVQMPHLDGLAAAPRIRSAAPGAVLVIMSSLPPAEVADAARAAGAHTYIDKATGVDTIIGAIRDVIAQVLSERSDDARSEQRS